MKKALMHWYRAVSLPCHMTPKEQKKKKKKLTGMASLDREKRHGKPGQVKR